MSILTTDLSQIYHKGNFYLYFTLSETAATVIDLTREPSVGRYIMFFHGSSKEGLKLQRAHGAASLAIAWSDDLVNWTWPGDR